MLEFSTYLLPYDLGLGVWNTAVLPLDEDIHQLEYQALYYLQLTL